MKLSVLCLPALLFFTSVGAQELPPERMIIGERDAGQQGGCQAAQGYGPSEVPGLSRERTTPSGRPASLLQEQSAVQRHDPPARVQGALLRMDTTTYDFGDVPRRGGDLVKEFAFVNDGTVPLVVTRVVTSCSCLRASFPKRPVPPGGEAAIRIIYEPHKSEPGAFHKVIHIYSNSADGRHVITVQGCSIDKRER